MTTEQYFAPDVTVRLVDDSVCITFLRGQHGDDVAEVWLPASKAVHAGAALLEIYFGRMQAARVAGKLHIEWEREQWERQQGYLPETEQTDVDSVF